MATDNDEVLDSFKVNTLTEMAGRICDAHRVARTPERLAMLLAAMSEAFEYEAARWAGSTADAQSLAHSAEVLRKAAVAKDIERWTDERSEGSYALAAGLVFAAVAGITMGALPLEQGLIPGGVVFVIAFLVAVAGDKLIRRAQRRLAERAKVASHDS